MQHTHTQWVWPSRDRENWKTETWMVNRTHYEQITIVFWYSCARFPFFRFAHPPNNNFMSSLNAYTHTDAHTQIQFFGEKKRELFSTQNKYGNEMFISLLGLCTFCSSSSHNNTIWKITEHKMRRKTKHDAESRTKKWNKNKNRMYEQSQ